SGREPVPLVRPGTGHLEDQVAAPDDLLVAVGELRTRAPVLLVAEARPLAGAGGDPDRGTQRRQLAHTRRGQRHPLLVHPHQDRALPGNGDDHGPSSPPLASRASTAAMVAMCTMSRTSLPSCSTCTGLRIP